MTQDSSGGDSTLLGRLKLGDNDAAAAIYQRYAAELKNMIQHDLAKRFAMRFDPEDIAHSALTALFFSVINGKPVKTTEGTLRNLLMTIAFGKLRNRVKYHDAAKRSAKLTVSIAEKEDLIDVPSEQDAVDVAEELEAMIRSLRPNAAQAMMLFLEGLTEEEVALRMDVTIPSVRRYRRQIIKQIEAIAGR